MERLCSHLGIPSVPRHLRRRCADPIHRQVQLRPRLTFDPLLRGRHLQRPLGARRLEEGKGIKRGECFDYRRAIGSSDDFHLSPTQHIRSLLSILAGAGATTIHFVASPEAASSATGYDHVVLEDSLKKTTAMTGHSGVGNMTWLKQCLIAGRLLPSAMMKVVEE